MAQNEPIRRSSPGPEIPDKLYFRIGDVAKLCGVPTYVLRFWEAEFPHLKPNKGGTGQRLYRRKDVEMALRVKRLLYDDGYTIPGARQVLKQEQRGTGEPQLALSIDVAQAAPGRDVRRLKELRKELEALHGLLSRPAGEPRSTIEPRSTVQSIRSERGPRLAPALLPVPKAFRASMNDLFDASSVDEAAHPPAAGDVQA